MPQDITDTSSFDDPVTTVDDGDDPSGLDFKAAIQALANRTRYLKDLIAAGHGTIVVNTELDPTDVTGTSYTANTWTDVAGMSITLTGAGLATAIGDEIYVMATGNCQDLGLSGEKTYVRAVIVSGGGIPVPSNVSPGTNAKDLFACQKLYTNNNLTAAPIVKLQAKSASGSCNVTDVTLYVRVRRP